MVKIDRLKIFKQYEKQGYYYWNIEGYSINYILNRNLGYKNEDGITKKVLQRVIWGSSEK
jgi:hypothetical protein